MENKQSPQFLRKRKFLLVLPLLVWPFATMAFWALGGGKAKPVTVSISHQGFNTTLPDVKLKDSATEDKLTAYQRAQRDSNAGGVSQSFINAMGLDKSHRAVTDSGKIPGSAVTPNSTADESSRQLQVRLNEINRKIAQPPVSAALSYPTGEQENSRANIQKLNEMMTAMKNRPAKDPELEQLNSMLAKIQAIQNPQSVTTRADQPNAEKEKPFQAIPAIIEGSQKVTDGAVVRLKLTDTVSIKGQQLNKGQELFGSCQIVNQRLLLNIKNVRLDNAIIPVDLTVFSLDGMPGIPAPEAELSGAASGGADNALQSMNFLSADQSLTTQAAAGGITAAKGLFSKKVRKVKVHLKNEFPVLLRNNEQKHN